MTLLILEGETLTIEAGASRVGDPVQIGGTLELGGTLSIEEAVPIVRSDDREATFHESDDRTLDTET